MVTLHNIDIQADEFRKFPEVTLVDNIAISSET